MTAGRLDEHLVHVALGTLVHSLVDLVHQRERRARKLGECEQVRDRRQSAFLLRKRGAESATAASVSTRAGRTNSSGLTMTAQLVQLDVSRLVFGITEANKDTDAPLLVVFFLVQTNLAEQAES